MKFHINKQMNIETFLKVFQKLFFIVRVVFYGCGALLSIYLLLLVGSFYPTHARDGGYGIMSVLASLAIGISFFLLICIGLLILSEYVFKKLAKKRILSFNICRTVNPLFAIGFATAFINTGEGIIGSILEPGIGYVLDILKRPDLPFSLANYQSSLTVLPFCYVISTIVISKLPDNKKDIIHNSNQALA